MSLPWVRVWTSLLDNDGYRLLSAAGKHTFTTSLMLAGKLDCQGRLEIENVGGLTVEQIAAYTSLKTAIQAKALDELKKLGFLTQDMLGTYAVARWDEKAGDEATRAGNAARQRRHRQRRRGDASVTEDRDGNGVTPLHRNAQTVTDKDKDLELEYELLRNSAIAFSEWPSAKETERFQRLAAIFLERFGNTTDPEKVKRHLGAYATALAAFRSRGATIEAAWSACEECWNVEDGVPLSGEKIKRTIAYIGKTDTTKRSRYAVSEPTGARTPMYGRCSRCDSFKRERDMVPNPENYAKFVCRGCLKPGEAA